MLFSRDIPRIFPVALIATLFAGVARADEATAAPPESHPMAKTTLKADAVPLIPRDVFFGNPDKASPDISPDGRRLAFLAPRDGVLNIWIAPIDNVAGAKPVTDDKHRGIRSFSWAFTGHHVLYTQDIDGDENWNVYSLDVETGETRDLTPQPKGSDSKQGDPTGRKRVQARITSISHRVPEEILIGLNDRDPRFHDVYRVNILTGKKRLAFNAVAEHFLAKHLGGRAEPIGTAYEGSSITIPNGADQLPDVAPKAAEGR